MEPRAALTAMRRDERLQYGGARDNAWPGADETGGDGL